LFSPKLPEYKNLYNKEDENDVLIKNGKFIYGELKQDPEI